MALLDVKNLKIHFFSRQGIIKAVDDISFKIQRDQTLGLIGESGCGKTTLALGLIQLLKPQARIISGKINFRGQDLLKLPQAKMRLLRGKTIAIIRQEAQNALNPVQTIGKQIIEGLLQHETINKKQAIQKAMHQLSLVGISPKRINSYPHELSGGMKQRAMVAIATICSPGFLILDEPTTGLDVIIQRQLLALINDLKNKLSMTSLLISHDLAVIAETCDQVAVMYAGRIVEQAEAASLYENPLHPYSKALISSYPSLRGPLKTFKSIPGSSPLDLINPPAGCRFQPRCKEAIPRCKEHDPKNVIINGHKVACHLF